MPFHKFFWAFKARNNIWLEIGVAGSPSGKKCYLRFPKPETRPPPTTIQTTFKPFLQTKHSLPILITTSDSLLNWIRDWGKRCVCTLSIFALYIPLFKLEAFNPFNTNLLFYNWHNVDIKFHTFDDHTFTVFLCRFKKKSLFYYFL